MVVKMLQFARHLTTKNKEKGSMNVVREIERINATEARLGISLEASWHAKYKNSAYVFLGGLPYDLTEGDIICIFSQFGEIVDCNLVRDKQTGKSKGFAFIAYENQLSTVLAVDNFNGAKVLERTLRVDHVENYRKPKVDKKDLDKPDEVAEAGTEAEEDYNARRKRIWDYELYPPKGSTRPATSSTVVSSGSSSAARTAHDAIPDPDAGLSAPPPTTADAKRRARIEAILVQRRAKRAEEEANPVFDPSNAAPGSCYKCGQPGHFAKECPNASAVDAQQGRTPATGANKTATGTGTGGTGTAAPPGRKALPFSASTLKSTVVATAVVAAATALPSEEVDEEDGKKKKLKVKWKAPKPKKKTEVESWQDSPPHRDGDGGEEGSREARGANGSSYKGSRDRNRDLDGDSEQSRDGGRGRDRNRDRGGRESADRDRDRDRERGTSRSGGSRGGSSKRDRSLSPVRHRSRSHSRSRSRERGGSGSRRG